MWFARWVYAKDKTRIERVQRRAARYVHNTYSRYSSVTAMLQPLNWETLQACRVNIYMHLCIIYKAYHNLAMFPLLQYATPATLHTCYDMQISHAFPTHNSVLICIQPYCQPVWESIKLIQQYLSRALAYHYNTRGHKLGIIHQVYPPPLQQRHVQTLFLAQCSPQGMECPPTVGSGCCNLGPVQGQPAGCYELKPRRTTVVVPLRYLNAAWIAG